MQGMLYDDEDDDEDEEEEDDSKVEDSGGDADEDTIPAKLIATGIMLVYVTVADGVVADVVVTFCSFSNPSLLLCNLARASTNPFTYISCSSVTFLG
jgi:hypothetical protein